MTGAASRPAEMARVFRQDWREHQSSRMDQDWPIEAWQHLVECRATGWTIPGEFGGAGCTSAEVLEGCIEVARGNLTVALILSQFHAAVARITDSERGSLKTAWLTRLALGTAFATVGISHLSTSRQHEAVASMTVTPCVDGFQLSGETPWVTGADQADLFVIGAAAPGGEQYLFGVPADLAGIHIGDSYELVALGATRTAPVRFDGVRLGEAARLAGPAERVLSMTSRGGAGSLTTSALALGHAWHAIDRLREEAERRSLLAAITDSLGDEAKSLQQHLMSAAEGIHHETWNAESLRAATTSLALRSSQAYLTAMKGAGFVVGHPAERLAREALFFLVWSCPQNVATRLMNELSRCEAIP